MSVKPTPTLARMPSSRAKGVALLSALALFAAACGETKGREPQYLVPGADAAHGRALIQRYGCGSCHMIPDVPGARGTVGPSLAGLAERSYVAGVLQHTPDNLVRWIEDPKAVDSLTAMPDLGVTRDEARDIAAYLYAHPK